MGLSPEGASRSLLGGIDRLDRKKKREIGNMVWPSTFMNPRSSYLQVRDGITDVGEVREETPRRWVHKESRDGQHFLREGRKTERGGKGGAQKAPSETGKRRRVQRRFTYARGPLTGRETEGFREKGFTQVSERRGRLI